MLIIKIYGHDRECKTVKISSFPCTIGRGFENDIIIEDSGASVAHAKITQTDEGLRLTDLDSTNGILLNGTKCNQITLDNSVEVQIGLTKLVFYHLDTEHEATRVINYHELGLPRTNAANKMSPILQLVILLLILFSIQGLIFYIGFGLQHKYSLGIVHAILSLGGCIIFTAFLSLIARAQTKRYHYFALFKVIISCTIIIHFFDLAGSTLFSMIDSLMVRDVLEYIVYALFLLWFFFQLFKIILPTLSLKKLQIAAVTTVASFMGTFTLIFYLNSMNDQNYHFQGVIGYPIFKINANSNNFNKVFKEINEDAKTIQEYRRETLEEMESIKKRL